MTLGEIDAAVVACERCPELRAYCAEVARVKRRAYRDADYWGKPVPGFGDPRARVVLIGLAPGAHGSNRTGRMFTGDASGAFLYPVLHRTGFASQPLAVSRDDGLTLLDAYITAAVRCAPPGNAPTPAQRTACFSWLIAEFELLTEARVLVTLGKTADDAAIRLMNDRDFRPVTARTPFAHGREIVFQHTSGRSLTVLASYHPSQQNTSTKKLTAPMFEAIFVRARTLKDCV